MINAFSITRTANANQLFREAKFDEILMILIRKSQDKKYEKRRGKVQSVGDIAEAVT